MRDVTAVLAEDSLARIEGAAGFTQEHNATRLIVRLNEALASPEIDYHILCFDIGIGNKAVTNNIYGDAGDAPAYRDGDCLICPLPEALTSAGEVGVQVEAHRLVGGEIAAVEKSGVFYLRFDPSVTGFDERVRTEPGLLPRLQALLAREERDNGTHGGVVFCTRTAYDALAHKHPGVFYLVSGTAQDPGGEEPQDPGGGEEPPVAVTGVALNTAGIALNPGGTQFLTTAVQPANATNQGLIWYSSNTAAATVSANGLVLAVAPGTATITVTTADGGYSAACAVTVAAMPALRQGSWTEKGVTVTVSGNRVTLNGTATSGGIGLFTGTHPTFFVPTLNDAPVWHTFNAGDTAVFGILNVTGTHTNTNGNAMFALKDAQGTTIGALAPNPAGTYTVTFTAATASKGFLCYLQNASVYNNYGFDVQLSVNGTAWF